VIPQANITAWRAAAPWSDDAQVEQDLILTRAVVELFAEARLSQKIALRGGTSLNKLFIQPPIRYSEDIDLVQTHAGPIGSLLDAIRALLDPWLGTPTRSRAQGGVTLTYRFESETAPVRPLRLKIEINTREHFALLGFQRRRLSVENPWFSGTAEVTTYELDELLGTKLRALYQRRKGRDLFDLWLCISRKTVDPERIVSCFREYMRHQGQAVSRAEFEQNLHDKENNAAFLNDIKPLLSAGVPYDASVAVAIVREVLFEKLPGEPWRLPGAQPSSAKRLKSPRRKQ
jgi:predicted nucleotidyltransferase component of viral defense system